jgi:uncharacterized membrane protein
MFDVVLAAGLWLLLRGSSRSAVGLAAVLWCPLLMLETYEAGHTDVIGAALVVLALVAMDRGRPMASGVALGLAIGVKYLWPALALVVLLPQAVRNKGAVRFVLAAGIVAVGCWIPYRSGISEAWATARMFSEIWAFNDPAFEALRRLLPGPRWVPMVVTCGLLLSLAAVLCLRRQRHVWTDVWLISGTALLLSPVAHPWYFLWIVPGLLLRPPAWLIVWVLAVPALHVANWHHVATGEWDTMPRLCVLVGVVPAVLLVRAWWLRLAHPDSVDGRRLLSEGAAGREE